MGPWSNVAVLRLVAQACPTLCDSIDSSPPGSSVHGDSPGKSTGVGCHAFCQVIFPTQGSNPGLPHCRWILYHLSHQGSCPYKRGRCYVNTQKHTGGRRCKDSRGEGHMKTEADISDALFTTINQKNVLSLWKFYQTHSQNLHFRITSLEFNNRKILPDPLP